MTRCTTARKAMNETAIAKLRRRRRALFTEQMLSESLEKRMRHAKKQARI